MIVTIHQPEHISYLGFWNKVASADLLVLLDNVKYEKNYFQNRNQIHTRRGPAYITVPVTKINNLIKDVEIADEYQKVAKRKILRTIKETYRKSPYFDEVFPMLAHCYNTPHHRIISLNIQLFTTICNYIGLDTKIVFASQLDVTGDKTDLLVDICHKTKATTYLSGRSGRNYLDMDKFDIPVVFQDFRHPTYPQHHREVFIPNMSIIDALFNLGPNVLTLIK